MNKLNEMDKDRNLKVAQTLTKSFLRMVKKMKVKQLRFSFILLEQIAIENKMPKDGELYFVNLTKLRKKYGTKKLPTTEDIKKALEIIKNNLLIEDEYKNNFFYRMAQTHKVSPFWQYMAEEMKKHEEGKSRPIFTYFNYVIVGREGMQEVLIEYKIDNNYRQHFTK